MVVHAKELMTAAEESRMIAALAAIKDQMLVRRVSWRTYQELLDAWGPKAPRHTYDRGSLEIMAKSSLHEVLKGLLGLFMGMLFEELKLDFYLGSETTLAREELERSLEPDQCYWIAHEPVVRGKRLIDFEHDPPPDLFIEIEVSRTILDRLAVLAKLGVQEVWRFSESRLLVGLLQPDETYAWGIESPTFPRLRLNELPDLICQFQDRSQLAVIQELRAWVRGQLAKQTEIHQ